MEFALGQEQVLLGDSVRSFLRDKAPIEVVRRHAEAGGSGHDEALWQGLAALGVPGLLVPEQYGGAGLGLLDTAVVAQALGEAAAPVPFVVGVAMATLALLRAGSADQQGAWLPRIARGEVRVAVGFVGFVGGRGGATISLDRARLSGAVEGVLDAGAATHLLVYLPDGRAAILAADAAGLSIDRRRTLDGTRPLAGAVLDGARAELLAAANDPREAALQVLDAGRVMLAADTLGAAQTMLDRAVAWAKQRVQFGRVIGSFQGVKHMCADMATMLEPCHALVWHAARAQDAISEEARLLACHAKAHLDEVGRDVARMATEVHGGMGFTDLMGLHFWLKRIGFNRQVLGGPERCREEAARVQGWAA
jgi:alkylation response protein AidB-like acyl-CoA dehydrogenase